MTGKRREIVDGAMFCNKCKVFHPLSSDFWVCLKTNPVCRINFRISNRASRKYRKQNPDKHRAACDAWRANNPEAQAAIAKRSKNKIRSTSGGIISHRMEVILRHALGSNKESRSWLEFVDFSLAELKVHLESLFSDGMNWELFNKGLIHIDHVVPKSWFSYSSINDEAFKKCWALNNLQPMWASDNIKKSNKYAGSPQNIIKNKN